MMKKIVLSMLVAMAMVACNEKSQQAEAVVEDQTVQQDTTGVKTSVERTPEEVVKAIDEIKAKSDFVPSGDIDKDAQDFVDMQLALAVMAADGKDTQEENDKVTAVMHILGEYYTNKGRQAEFQAKLGQKLQAGMAKIQREQK